MYYVRGGAVLFSTQFLLILSGFLLSVGFAHLTSKELFGQYQFVLAVIGTISVLALPGTNTAVLLGVSENKEGTLLQGVRLKLKWCVLGILALIATAGYFYLKQPQYADLWPIFLIAIIFFPILYSLDVTHSFFMGRKKFTWSCAFQLITEAGSSIGALASLFFTKNLLVIITIYLIIQAVGDVLAFLFARSKLRNAKTDPELASYSGHLTVINFIPYIKTFFDKLIVTYFLGFAATAIYTIAAAMAEQLYAVSKSISALIFPKLTTDKKEVIYKHVIRHIPKLIFFFIVVAGVAAVLAPIIIPFFFSEQYRDAVLIAQLLLLVSIPRAVAFVLTRVQEAQRQKKKLYTINVIYAAVEMISLLALIPLYGMYGLVAAKGISNLVYCIISWKNLY
jgi:O-antigen/teichoic acid export membrane protein